VVSHAPRIAQTAIELAKLARLLPAVVLDRSARSSNKRRAWAREQDLMYVDVADVLGYEETARRTAAVAQAHVRSRAGERPHPPWRPSDGGKEHLAIVVGEIDPPSRSSFASTRVLTGDLLARCAATAPAAARRHHELAKQVRACCLSPRKPRHRPGEQAARLRAAGRRFDTIDANEQLGFDADERIYAPAATMLARMASSACG